MVAPRKIVVASLCVTSLLLTASAFAQTTSTTQTSSTTKPDRTTDQSGPTTTSTAGDTGIWVVPSAEVLKPRGWSVSFSRVNQHNGQGFSDISNLPLTFAFGVASHLELFGSYAVLTRID